MGTGSSFRHNHDEDDVLGDDNAGPGVIKRIPIEVKPRGKIGKRPTLGSFGRKQQKGGSLRSALSVDLENPEVEKIRKEFEMYRLNKDQEIANMKKRDQKFETENKRLRAELQALQKTCTHLRAQRDAALDAEQQALARAETFENDRDKIQRQFKIFRETKEGEIQNLLKAKRELETKLSKVHQDSGEDSDSSSTRGLEMMIGNGNPGDWWTALESEPSLGSITHLPAFKGPEFAHSTMEMDGPFTNVNKDDWNNVAMTLAQLSTALPDMTASNTIRVYISAPSDMFQELDILYKDHLEVLRSQIEIEGRYLVTIHFDEKETDTCLSEEDETSTSVGTVFQKQRHFEECMKRQIDHSTVFMAFLGQQTNSFTKAEYECGFLNHPGSRPAIFCFREVEEESRSSYSSQVRELRDVIQRSSSVKMVDHYTSPAEGAAIAFNELSRIIHIELGIDSKDKEKTDTDSGFADMDGPEQLCGGGLWDIHSDYEQVEAVSYAARSSCQLGFEKHYERLNIHMSAAGPLPPLLISGGSGSGRSLLLAKWIQLQQQKGPNSSLVLYHFVGNNDSCSADPFQMIRRLTNQLMQHVTAPPALTCDPIRLVDEFPRWLEKVSSKTHGGVILVLDSIDGFQNGESHLNWLLDPLPVDSRLVVSCHEDSCPQAWRSWPTIHLESLSNKNVKELLRAELTMLNAPISMDHENKILTHCRTPATCTPLYVMAMASDLAGNTDNIDKRVQSLVETSDSVELFEDILCNLRDAHETSATQGMLAKVLAHIYAARTGMGEWELFSVIPTLDWTFWACLSSDLLDRQVVAYRSGIIVIAHEQARQAVSLYCSLTDNGAEQMTEIRKSHVQYFSQFLSCNSFCIPCSTAGLSACGQSAFLRPGQVTCRVADELPWLLKELGRKEEVQSCIVNLCIFQRLYGRGRCAELINYWQYIGADNVSMADTYFNTTKMFEGMVGQFDGMVTLPRIADTYEALGRFLRDLGLLEKAKEPLHRAYELRVTAMDPDHPSVAQSLHQLAGLHAQWNKFNTAEDLYKQSLEIYENAFGPEHYFVAKELDALSVLYQKQDRHDAADPLHKRAVMIRKKYKGPRVNSGQMKGVDPLRRRAVRLEELAMGPDSPDMARTLNELGVLYYLQNNSEAAEQFFQRSLDMRIHTLEEDHPDIAQSFNNLAGLYVDKKQYEKAEALYEQALEIRMKHFQPENPSIAAIIKHLAILYKQQGKLKKAEPLYQQAVDIREKSFGAHHPSVATALVNLAVLYSQQNKLPEALPLYERALSIYEDSFGPNHARVSETLRNLALLRYDLGDFEIAARMYKRAEDIKENDPTYGKDVCQHSSSGDTVSTVKLHPPTQYYLAGEGH